MSEVRCCRRAAGARRTAAIVAAAALPAVASAHGFGQRFDLPLPLWLWELGAGATIVLSFVLVAIFLGQHATGAGARRKTLLRTSASPKALRIFLGLLRAAAASIFLLALAAGFFGVQTAYSNLLPTMVWILWWVGVAFTSALVGDVWPLLDPLRTLAQLLRAALRTIVPSFERAGPRPYPRQLAAWPAVVFFLAFAWTELVWHGKDIPFHLASVVLAYAVVTWLGMLVYGCEAWLASGEAFSIAFGVLGRFAPLGAARVRDAGNGEAEAVVELRPYGAGLLSTEPVHASMLVFVICMLATVTFDGFQETPLMQAIDTALQQQHAIATLLFDLSEWGLDEMQVVHTVLLIAFPLVFLAAFWLAGLAMIQVVQRFAPASPGVTPRLTAGRVAREFVLTLVPIAVAYHLSHYFSLLVTAGQFIIPLASDPFGLGWNLFGTATYRVDFGIVSPYVFWYSAVIMIVTGHVIAVVLAHTVAVRLFSSRRAAVVSQIPMVLLMVAYTTLSLWILAQPIVG